MNNTVLLVDDDPNLIAGIRRGLRKEPFKTLSASSAEEALALMRRVSVDVVISDYQMPGMGGVEFLKAARRAYPETVRFLLTGNATLDVAIEAINEGEIMRFFTKPYNNVDLAVTIRQALAQKKLLTVAKKLMEENRRQATLLEQVEQQHPGITRLEKDESGAIVFPALYEEVDQLAVELSQGW